MFFSFIEVTDTFAFSKLTSIFIDILEIWYDMKEAEVKK